MFALPSGITWRGFDNFYYLFTYEDTRDGFGIPHDIRILKEVYAVPDPDRAAVPPDRASLQPLECMYLPSICSTVRATSDYLRHASLP